MPKTQTVDFSRHLEMIIIFKAERFVDEREFTLEVDPEKVDFKMHGNSRVWSTKD